MKKTLILAATMGAMLSACGAAEEQAEEAFRTSFVEECISSASATGAPVDAVTPICECSADKVIAEVGTTLSIAPAVADRIMNECMAENTTTAEPAPADAG